MLDAATKDDTPSNLDSATHAEIADYIADMLQDLRDLSGATGQSSLSLLLELAQREARREAQRDVSVNQGPPPPALTG
jgi:hypothetical protein